MEQVLREQLQYDLHTGPVREVPRRIRLRPTRGGRPSQVVWMRLGKGGIYITQAGYRLLGSPRKLVVELDLVDKEVIIAAAQPDSADAYSTDRGSIHAPRLAEEVVRNGFGIGYYLGEQRKDGALYFRYVGANRPSIPG